MARLLPPESAALEVVSREKGGRCGTLQRWVDDARCKPARGRTWSAGARLDAVIVTAVMAKSGKSARCREQSLFQAELNNWRASATAALVCTRSLVRAGRAM